MVNLIAGKRVVPELMQNEMTGERMAAETARLLDNAAERAKMKEELARVVGAASGRRGRNDDGRRMQWNACGRFPGESRAIAVKTIGLLVTAL